MQRMCGARAVHPRLVGALPRGRGRPRGGGDRIKGGKGRYTLRQNWSAGWGARIKTACRGGKAGKGGWGGGGRAGGAVCCT